MWALRRCTHLPKVTQWVLSTKIYTQQQKGNANYLALLFRKRKALIQGQEHQVE